MDKSISFEFWIDDENIPSIRTLRKICADLKIDSEFFEFIKSDSMTIEMLSEKIEEEKYSV